MSGMFEVLAASDGEQDRARQAAADKLAAAVYDVRQEFGDFLFKAADIQEFRTRVALVKNDMMKVVDRHIPPVSGVMGRIATRRGSILEREFKAVRKGAPFADYENFADCTRKNSDKGNPDAYCGEIKHRTEDKTSSIRVAGLDESLAVISAPENPALTKYAGWEAVATGDGPALDTDETYHERSGPLIPEGDWQGFQDSVDQGADSKVDSNVFVPGEHDKEYTADPSSTDFVSGRESRLALRYLSFCHRNNLPPTLAGLERHGKRLPADQYLAIANSLDKLARLPRAEKVKVARVVDWTVRQAEKYQGEGDVEDKSGPFAGPHGSFPIGTPSDLNDAKSVCNFPSVHSKHPGTCDKIEHRQKPAARHQAADVPHLYSDEEAEAYDPESAQIWREHGEDYGGRNRALRDLNRQRNSGRRQAAPDFLQKAKDALEGLLNQKAEDFQSGIAPLQQAYQVIQQSQAAEMAANPMSVQPPAGTVNVLPDPPQGLPGADQGMGDPMGGAPADQSAPPPAAAAAGAAGQPPDPTQQMAASRKRGGHPKGQRRQGAGVVDNYRSWQNRRPDLERGNPADIEVYEQEKGPLGPRARHKLHQELGMPDFSTAAYVQACKVFGRQAVDASRHHASDDGWCPECGDTHTARTASHKQAWMGWGPAQIDHHPRVAGWEWDRHLEAYTANRPGRFACSCGNEMDMPGHHECKCGKLYNGYVIGTGGQNHEASAEKYLVRELMVRPDVIVANRHAAGDSEANPADFPSDHHPSVGKIPATPEDWANRDRQNNWTSHSLPRRKRRQPA